MYENSRFLKNRFTFCSVNTNFGQQWAPPAYYHLTPIVSKGKHWCDISLINGTAKKVLTICSVQIRSTDTQSPTVQGQMGFAKSDTDLTHLEV